MNSDVVDTIPAVGDRILCEFLSFDHEFFCRRDISQ